MKDNFYIRIATTDDALKCAEIHIKSWEFAYGRYIDAEVIGKRAKGRNEMWLRLLEENVNSHYVAVYNNTIIGIISLGFPREEDLSESTFELSGLYIDPDYIGRGFGTMAMRWIQSEIFSRGYTAVSLWVFDKNKRAQKFYKKFGFEKDWARKDTNISGVTAERYICTSIKNYI